MTVTVYLPGGIHRDGSHHRSACLHPVDGELEMTIAACDKTTISRPARTTHILTSAVERIGDLVMNRELAEELSVGDRTFLMLHIGAMVAGDNVWSTSRCSCCGEQFDICVKRTGLTIRESSHTYPITKIALNGTSVLVRTPIGADQQWLCDHRPSNPRAALLARCITTVNDKQPHDKDGYVAGLGEAERDILEQVIESMGPEVECSLSTRCPECGKQQRINFDPCRFHGSMDDLEKQIHTLAFYYHWSEGDILSIPRNRRLRYLQMIERERGLYG